MWELWRRGCKKWGWGTWQQWWRTTMRTRWIRCFSMTQMATWLRYATVRTSQSFPSLPAHSNPGRVCTTAPLLDISVDSWRLWWWTSVDSWRLWWWSPWARIWWTSHSKFSLLKRWSITLLQMYLLLKGLPWSAVWFDTESNGFVVFVVKDSWIGWDVLISFPFSFLFENGRKIWWWIIEMVEMYSLLFFLKKGEKCIKWITVFYPTTSLVCLYICIYGLFSLEGVCVVRLSVKKVAFN